MDKCRICFKNSKRLRSLYDAEDGITYHNMINYFTNLKLQSENNMSENICLSCCKRVVEAYTLKIDIERSEMILNETAYFKRIHFDNFHEIKMKFDYKPVISSDPKYFEDLFGTDMNTITYNEIIIRKLKDCNNIYEGRENQLSLKEFLSSVKMESDEDYGDPDYEIDANYDSDSHSDYSNSNILTVTKKGNRHCSKKANITKYNKTKQNLKSVSKKPIKPIYLSDVKIEHAEKLKEERKKPKMKPRKRRESICPHCGKLLASKYLHVHMLTHTGVRPYKCEECLKSFVTKNLLQYHRRIHTAPKIFKCDQCISSFINKTMLKIHMLTHSDEKAFLCDICNKGFKRKHSLNLHVLIHNFGKKRFQCELCPMSFHTNSQLKHHIRIHTRERPYRCDICSQPYSYKRDFNRHCLKKHGIFLKQRSVYIMNEEVLQEERALMRELALKARSSLKEEDIPKVFEKPRGALALKQAIKAVEANQIPMN